jgi:AcrR family transcriptional regulator
MARWEPGARERLIRSAFELFQEQGFAATTVPQIAARAGVTNRTFFRYFGDKREVLFGSEDQAATELRAALAGAPAGLGPADLITWALRLTAREFPAGYRAELRALRGIVESDEGLMERALSKRRVQCALLGDALQERGLRPAQARLLAEASVSALYIAIGEWVQRQDETGIDVLASEALASLRADLDGITPAYSSQVQH